jgi:hypothetical protein
MTQRSRKDPPAPEKPKEDAPAPAAAPAPAPRPELPRREGPDAFQDSPQRKASPLLLDPLRPQQPLKRGRTFDPRLVPRVPASVTTDPSRQFHALLGLPPEPKAAPRPQPKPGSKPDLDALLASLNPARARVIRQILSGENTRLKRALLAFIQDAKFARLDFESQRRALAAFDLRWP